MHDGSPPLKTLGGTACVLTWEVCYPTASYSGRGAARPESGPTCIMYTYIHLGTCAVHTYLGSEWVAGGSDQAILRTV